MSEQKKTAKENFAWFKNLNFFKKLKEVRHIGLIITIIFVLILLIILFGDFGLFSNSKASTKASTESSTYTTSLDYAKVVEDKLCSIVKNIKGAGKVEVMVSLDSGTSLVLASTEEKVTKGTGNDMSTTVSTGPVIVKQDGNDTTIVIGEELPKIKGVVVVSSGAKDVAVRLNILKAVQTLLDLDDTQIQILIGE